MFLSGSLRLSTCPHGSGWTADGLDERAGLVLSPENRPTLLRVTWLKWEGSKPLDWEFGSISSKSMCHYASVGFSVYSYLAFHLSGGFLTSFSSLCLLSLCPSSLSLSRSPPFLIFPSSFSMKSRKGTVPGARKFILALIYFNDEVASIHRGLEDAKRPQLESCPHPSLATTWQVTYLTRSLTLSWSSISPS